MSALHEAARRVVSAWVSTRPAWIEQCNAAVLALDAALDAALKAEPAQEPAAYIHRQGRHWEVSERPLTDDEEARGWTEEPLYTAPPRRPPLTDEEIRDAVQEADLDWQAGWTLDEHEPNRFTTLVRAVERKVRGE